MIERTYSEPEPNRKISSVTHEVLTVDCQRIVRKTVIYTDADSGQPLDVWATDHPLPPMVVWQDEAVITENPNEEEN